VCAVTRIPRPFRARSGGDEKGRERLGGQNGEFHRSPPRSKSATSRPVGRWRNQPAVPPKATSHLSALPDGPENEANLVAVWTKSVRDHCSSCQRWRSGSRAQRSAAAAMVGKLTACPISIRSAITKRIRAGGSGRPLSLPRPSETTSRARRRRPPDWVRFLQAAWSARRTRAPSPVSRSLQFEQLGVAATEGDQLRMGALLLNVPLGQHLAGTRVGDTLQLRDQIAHVSSALKTGPGC